MPEHFSFSLMPSKQQLIIELVFLLLSGWLLGYFISVWLVALLVIAIAAVLIFNFYQFKTQSIVFQQGGWWLQQTSCLSPMQWRTGSVRRKYLILWRYGKYPWQQLIIRRDSLAQGEYQNLLRALTFNSL